MKIILDSRTDSLRIISPRVRFDDAGDDDLSDTPDFRDDSAGGLPGSDAVRDEVSLLGGRWLHPRFPDLVG
jgi:hypothetical protein